MSASFIAGVVVLLLGLVAIAGAARARLTRLRRIERAVLALQAATAASDRSLAKLENALKETSPTASRIPSRDLLAARSFLEALRLWQSSSAHLYPGLYARVMAAEFPFVLQRYFEASEATEFFKLSQEWDEFPRFVLYLTHSRRAATTRRVRSRPASPANPWQEDPSSEWRAAERALALPA